MLSTQCDQLDAIRCQPYVIAVRLHVSTEELDYLSSQEIEKCSSLDCLYAVIELRMNEPGKWPAVYGSVFEQRGVGMIPCCFPQGIEQPEFHLSQEWMPRCHFAAFRPADER